MAAKKKQNWMTSVAGIIALLGAGAMSYGQITGDPRFIIGGQVATAIAGGGGLIAAKDATNKD